MWERLCSTAVKALHYKRHKMQKHGNATVTSTMERTEQKRTKIEANVLPNPGHPVGPYFCKA